MSAIEQSVPIITCPRCAWARGGLSLMGLPMLVDAFLKTALTEHLLATHGLTPADLEAPRPVAVAEPEVAPTEVPTERRSA